MADTVNAETLILIPAYKPDEKLLTLVDELAGAGFVHQLVINDGSGAEFDDVFAQIAERPFCTLLEHEQNMGKGQALKTGLARFCENVPECRFVITADADGQHTPASIAAVAAAMPANSEALVLGVRSFDEKHMPILNKIGNTITKGVMTLMLGRRISDTQTGLRGMNKENARRFLKLKGERYEYETNMLLECKKNDIPIAEVPIETIYLEQNKSSHFNMLLDSTKIYLQLIKYALASGLATLIDIGLFMLLAKLLEGQAYYVFISTLLARIVSLTVNYFTNLKTVFHSQKRKRETFSKYAILCAVNILFATWFTDLLILHTAMPLLVIKIIVSLVLFIVNFFIQKKWVF